MKNVEDVYPLSPMQQGMLFHTLYAPGSGAYVVHISCTMRGALHIPAFKRAWQTVLQRHQILRSAFLWERLDSPLQVVRQHVELDWNEQDWRELPPAAQKERLDAYLWDEHLRGFDLSKAPLLHLTLFRLADDTYQFIWHYSHLLLDGWSVHLVFHDLFALYQSYSQGRELKLPRPRPYRDYIGWLQRQELSKAEEFWRRTLKGFTAPTPLGFEGAGGAAPVAGGATYREIRTKLSSPATARLQSLGRGHKVTLNTFVQGAWALLLSRYSGEDDLVFGVTVTGRPVSLSGVETMVGLLINTLPMRVRVSEAERLIPWLQKLQEHQFEVRQYEYSALIDVQGWSEVARGLPLFESFVVFENHPVAANTQEVEGLQFLPNRVFEQASYPITLLAEPGEEMTLRIMYNCARFSEATVRRTLNHIVTLLERMSDDAEQRLCDLSALTDTERTQLLVGFNDTASRHARVGFVHELISEQARRTPEAVALSFEGATVSYGDLEARANRLAHHLRRLGVGPDTPVGLLMERSAELVVALLAVWKAGGAYVPLDPDYPAPRLSFMCSDAGAALLLTQPHLRGRAEALTASAARVLTLGGAGGQGDESAWAGESPDPPAVALDPANLAYVIYTSGSTGEPKGAANTHAALLNRLLWMQEQFPLDASDRVVQKTPSSFDVSAWEFFWPLLAGARLVVAAPGGHRDAAYLAGLMEAGRVTTAHFVPSMLSAFLAAEGAVERCAALRRVICSGEALSYELQERFFARSPADLYNLYGPTEAAVDVTWWRCERGAGRRGAGVPIGRPIANTRIHILEARGGPAPDGVAGELYIGGVAPARGYWRRPALTAERFVPDPFSPRPGGRLYRTGDVARYLGGGEVEYVGRADTQVKVRGFRIELGEVEAALCGHEGVRAAAVVAREEAAGGRRLAAYVVPREGAPEVTAGGWREYLGGRLPED